MMPTTGSLQQTVNPSSRRNRYLGDILVIVLGLLGLLFVLKARADGSGTTTATTLALSASTVSAGTVVTFTATVTNPSAVTMGLVMFCDASATYCTDTAVIGTAQLTSAGTAIIKRVPGIGSHSYKAAFVPTTSNRGSTSSAQALTVTGTYAVTAAISPSGVAGNYTLTGTVAGKNSLVSTPTGSVSFVDTTNGNYVLGSAALGAATRTDSLAAQSTYTTGDHPQAVAVGDFDNDGKLDLVVANYGSNTVSFMKGNGDGTFQSKVDYATGTNPISITVGDFVTADGKLDLVVANWGSDTVSYLKGNGNGTFQTQVTFSTGHHPTAVGVGDFKADGNLDLAIVNYDDATVSVRLGSGSGTFGSITNHTVGTHPRGIAVGDFDSDEKLELAVTNAGSNTVSWLASNGDGSFKTKVDYTTGTSPYGVEIADFNRDGHLDMAVANNGSGSVSVFMGIGNGTFQSKVDYTVGANPQGIAVGDFDGDGKADLVVTNSGSGTVSILKGNGDGTFQAQITYATGITPLGVATGDFSSDDLADVAVTNDADDTAGVLLGKVTQTASAVSTGVSVPGSGSAHLVAADYPGDSHFAARTSSTVSLTSTQVTTTLVLTANPTASNYGQSVVLTATLSPSTDGSLTTTGETVTFKNQANENGPSTLGTATLNSSGVATLTLTSMPSGTNSLKAVYAGDTNFLGSSSSLLAFVVTPVQTLTVTALNATRLYGVANPTFTYAITGFVNGDTPSVVTGTPSLSTTATISSTAGRYPIVAALGTLAATGYNFAFVNATLTISSTGSQAPNIQGRWEFAVTSGDLDSQVALMGPSTFSTYLLQTSGSTTLSLIPQFTTHTVACDGNGWINIALSNSSIDASGNVSITFTDTQPDLSTFQYVFAGALMPGQSGSPTLITGTYQRSSGGCTQGSLGTGTPDGNFVATFFPDLGGTYEGSFEAPNEGTGGASQIEVPATFSLTTNSDKTLSGTVSSPNLKSSLGAVCFGGSVTLQAGMPEGVSYQSGEAFELYGIAPNGARLWVNAYATNADGFLPAAVGEDGYTLPAYGPNDGTNNSYIAFYGISGGPCDGLGGGDAPFQLVKNQGWTQRRHGQKIHSPRRQNQLRRRNHQIRKISGNTFGEQRPARKP